MDEPPTGQPPNTGTTSGAPGARQRSSLGLKITGRIAVIVPLFGIVQFFVVREITRRQFEDVERDNLLDRTQRIFETFEREAAFLKTLTASKAAWRATYDYAVRPSQAYLDGNFGGDWPRIHDIDFVLMVAMDGRRLWSSDGYPTFQLRGPEAFDSERFPVDDPYLFPRVDRTRPTDHFIGMIGSSHSAWIYCAHPITSEDLTAPPRGMLLFGRRIDKFALSSYLYGKGDDLELVPYDEAPTPDDSDDRLTVSSYPVFHGPRTAVRREAGKLVSYTPFADTAGTPLAALRLASLRTSTGKSAGS